jgi:hypothetical protein
MLVSGLVVFSKLNFQGFGGIPCIVVGYFGAQVVGNMGFGQPVGKKPVDFSKPNHQKIKKH